MPKNERLFEPELMMIETERLRIYPASQNQMEAVIRSENDAEMKKAYSEMLDGCLKHPDQWEWYAMWMIELKDGTHIGDLCFKGLEPNGIAEIGYGILDAYQRRRFATEAVTAAVTWALQDPKVTVIEAETDPENRASQRVLEKCGFIPNGKTGEEGPRFELKPGKAPDLPISHLLIREVRENKKEYLPLLLLADEQENMIDQYIDRGTEFVLEKDGTVIGVCVVTDEGNDVLEVQNLAVEQHCQGQGYGKLLLAFAEIRYAGRYSVLQVGTGDSLLTVPFYERCGFVRHHIIKNYFADHYDHPIYEAGRRLTDKIYLRKTLLWQTE